MNGKRWPCPKRAVTKTGSTGYALFGEPERDSQRSFLLGASSHRDTEASLMSAFGGKNLAMHVLSRRKLAAIIYTSKFNRAYETAIIAGLTDVEKTADLTEGGLVVTPNENNRRADALRKLLATNPRPGEHPRRAWQGLVRCQGRR